MWIISAPHIIAPASIAVIKSYRICFPKGKETLCPFRPEMMATVAISSTAAQINTKTSDILWTNVNHSRLENKTPLKIYLHTLTGKANEYRATIQILS